MRRLLFAAFVLALTPAAAFAQNPCADTSGTQLQLNPTTIFVELPEQNATEADGSARVTDYLAAYFAEGADPNTATPVQGPSTMQKTSFTLIAGTGSCYRANLPASIPTGQRLTGALKARRAASATVPAAESPWDTSNPFASAPTTLAPLGRLRVAR